MTTGFPQQRVILLIGIVPRDPFTKYEVDRVENNKKWIGLVPRDLCTKYKVDMLPNNKVMDVCPCCDGNKVSLATTHSIDCYCPKGHLYQNLKLVSQKDHYIIDDVIIFGKSWQKFQL